MVHVIVLYSTLLSMTMLHLFGEIAAFSQMRQCVPLPRSNLVTQHVQLAGVNAPS